MEVDIIQGNPHIVELQEVELLLEVEEEVEVKR